MMGNRTRKHEKTWKKILDLREEKREENKKSIKRKVKQEQFRRVGEEIRFFSFSWVF
jgi:hypothetical protein